jgi:hypothetical protein
VFYSTRRQFHSDKIRKKSSKIPTNIVLNYYLYTQKKLKKLWLLISKFRFNLNHFSFLKDFRNNEKKEVSTKIYNERMFFLTRDLIFF